MKTQYWANVEARVFKFHDDIPNAFDPPPLEDQALLQRLNYDEENEILGVADSDGGSVGMDFSRPR